MSDDQRDGETRYLRAREVLRDSGFVFDDFINAEMRKILISDPEDAAGREVAYMRARVATELKQMLVSETEEYEGNQLIRDRYGRNQQPNV